MAIADTELLAGRYRVLGPLGAGGAGSVVLARDERLDRLVAVKRMHVDAPAEVVRRFRREARIGAALSHPNLVMVYDAVSVGDGVLIAMEYVPGETLAGILRRGPLAPAEVVRVVGSVADALDHVHESGIVHRDVKPSNVLLDGNVVKLADLGISISPDESRVTRTGAVIGTAAYMAPEQIEGRFTGAQADVYSLAAVAFECLSGHRPRTGATLVELAHRAVTEPPPDIRSVMPDASPALAQLLQRGMARDPRERPQSAGLLAGMLEAAIDDDATITHDDADEPWPLAPPAAVVVTAAAGLPAAAGVPAAAARPAGVAEPAPERDHALLRRSLVVVLALLALVAGAAIVRLGLDGDPERVTEAGGAPTTAPAASTATGAAEPGTTTTPASEVPPSTTETAPAATAPAATAPAATAPVTTAPDSQVQTASSAPAEAVRSFYEMSAGDDFKGGWALLGSGARAQLRNFGTYRNTLRSLVSIEFEDLRTTSEGGDAATVAFATVARHTDRTDRCRGTAQVSRSGSTWVIERFSVAC